MWEGTASELACAFCGGPGDQAGLGPLLGPVGGTEYHVHRPCALWSPEVRSGPACWGGQPCVLSRRGVGRTRRGAGEPPPAACREPLPPPTSPPAALSPRCTLTQHLCPLLQVHESENGTLLRVLEAVRRGRQLKCAHCGRRGASTGCRVEKCRCTFHAPCAQLAGATFYANHCLACPEHARRFTKHAVHPQ